MCKKLVYLNEPIAPVALEKLSARYQIVNSYDRIDEIEGIITRKEAVDRSIISRSPKLKIISDHGTGTDMIDLEAAREFGVKVTNTPGLNAKSVAELAAGFMLALSYRIKQCNTGMEKGAFERFGLPELNGNEVSGKKLGIIGSGYTAQKLSLMMKTAFCMEVHCYNPHRTARELEEKGFIKEDSLEKLFQEMDFVSIHAPLTEETRNLVDRNLLCRSNPNLILVNTSRGGIVNEQDLYTALKENWIRGAGLDVFELEPPSPDNPLLALPNFLGTLHVGGSTQEALDRVGLAAVENIIQVLG